MSARLRIRSPAAGPQRHSSCNAWKRSACDPQQLQAADKSGGCLRPGSNVAWEMALAAALNIVLFVFRPFSEIEGIPSFYQLSRKFSAYAILYKSAHDPRAPLAE